MAKTNARDEIYGIVPTDRRRAPTEPLFAHHAQLWLRVWVLIQLAALTTGTILAMSHSGSPGSLFGGAAGGRLAIALVVVVALHVAGFLCYQWLTSEAWRGIAFVLMSWGFIFWTASLHREYGVLVLGALLQGCIFLPFWWIVGALVALVVLDVGAIWSGRYGGRNGLANTMPILVLGVIVGSVVLYIHRSNRDAAVQDDLLRRLDAAQHDLATRSREAGVLEERQRLARDLHDTLAQGFTSVIAQLAAAELILNQQDDRRGAHEASHDDRAARAAPYLARAQGVSRTSLSEIRRLVLALRPTELADAPLPAALDRVVRQWATLYGVIATFEARDVPDLQQDAQVTLLRAAQEGLNNVARHASAREVSVRLSCVDDLVLLEVDDDGTGIRDQVLEQGRGIGLAGMRERAAALGGRVIVESNAGHGTSLTVALPLATVMASDPQLE